MEHTVIVAVPADEARRRWDELAADHPATVSFEALPSGATRVHARIDESDEPGRTEHGLQRDLERFKLRAEGSGEPAPGDADLAPRAHDPVVGSPGGLDPRHRQEGI